MHLLLCTYILAYAFVVHCVVLCTHMQQPIPVKYCAIEQYYTNVIVYALIIVCSYNVVRYLLNLFLIVYTHIRCLIRKHSHTLIQSTSRMGWVSCGFNYSGLRPLWVPLHHRAGSQGGGCSGGRLRAGMCECIPPHPKDYGAKSRDPSRILELLRHDIKTKIVTHKNFSR